MTVVNTPSTFSKETLLKQGPILEVVIGYKIEQLDPSNSLYALIDTGADDPVIDKNFASSLGLPISIKPFLGEHSFNISKWNMME